MVADAGDAFVEGPSEGSSGDGEWLSPLDGEGRAWRAMYGGEICCARARAGLAAGLGRGREK